MKTRNYNNFIVICHCLEHIDDASLFKTPEVPRGQPTLDEITNKVFEELRVGKSDSKYDEDEGSCKVCNFTNNNSN